jgi:hypothetical protein
VNKQHPTPDPNNRSGSCPAVQTKKDSPAIGEAAHWIDCHCRKEGRDTTQHTTPHHQATKGTPRPVKRLAGHRDACLSCLVYPVPPRPSNKPINSSCSPGPGDSFHSSPLDCDPGYTFHTAFNRERERERERERVASTFGAFRSRAFQPKTRVPRPRVNRIGTKLWTANLRPAGFLLGVLGLGRLSRLFSRPAQIDWFSDYLAWPAIV